MVHDEETPLSVSPPRLHLRFIFLCAENFRLSVWVSRAFHITALDYRNRV